MTTDQTRAPSIKTLVGWRAYVQSQAPERTASGRVKGPQWRVAAGDESTRIDYHTYPHIFETPDMRQTILRGQRLLLLGRHEVAARRGLIVSGLPTLGKTTALASLGKKIEVTEERRNGTGGRTDSAHVVYLTVPAEATPRMIAVEFTRFLGIPTSPRQNVTDVLETACQAMDALRTKLIIVDEVHNLSLRSQLREDASDTIKFFAERVPAMMVLAGVELAGSNLFSGARGAQTKGRNVLMEFAPFTLTTDEKRSQWNSLVAAYDESLWLAAHKPGDLLKHTDYLHERTGGFIGSLSLLVRDASVDAILNGEERITRATLDDIELDAAAESQRTRPLARPRRKRRGAA